VVDKIIGGRKTTQAHNAGIRESINAALAEATSGTVIKITSNLYISEEPLIITKANITLGPKETGGEVTIQSVIIIDVGNENICTISQIRMLLKGPPKQEQLESARENRSEHFTEEACSQDFFSKDPDDHYCIILLKSGCLRLTDCSLSLDGNFKSVNSRVSCIATMPGSRVEMVNCKLKGDSVYNSQAIGLHSINSDIMVKHSTFAHFKSGGLVSSSIPKNILFVDSNTFLSCETTAMYFKGPETKPVIIGNTILFCKLSQMASEKWGAITTECDVKAKIFMNTLSMNDRGIQCNSNGSYIIDNTIEKTHGNGIFITGNNEAIELIGSGRIGSSRILNIP
jgi:hypothetical protein